MRAIILAFLLALASFSLQAQICPNRSQPGRSQKKYSSSQKKLKKMAKKRNSSRLTNNMIAKKGPSKRTNVYTVGKPKRRNED